MAQHRAAGGQTRRREEQEQRELHARCSFVRPRRPRARRWPARSPRSPSTPTPRRRRRTPPTSRRSSRTSAPTRLAPACRSTRRSAAPPCTYYTGRAAALVHRGVRGGARAADVRQHAHDASKTGRQRAILSPRRGRWCASSRCASTTTSSGSGATAGANRLVAMLGRRRHGGGARGAGGPEAERPIVFVGPTSTTPTCCRGATIADVVHRRGGARRPRPRAAAGGARGGGGAAAARRRLLGRVERERRATDVDAVTALLHSHNALAIWDYASAAPHAPVCMNLPAAAAAHASLLAKDAVFSPHKFPGGCGGRAVFKSHPPSLLRKADGRRASVAPGGGSVFFSRDAHVYARAEEAREEAGRRRSSEPSASPLACSCNRLSGGGRSRRRTSVYAQNGGGVGIHPTSRCSATARGRARRAPSRRAAADRLVRRALR